MDVLHEAYGQCRMLRGRTYAHKGPDKSLSGQLIANNCQETQACLSERWRWGVSVCAGYGGIGNERVH